MHPIPKINFFLFILPSECYNYSVGWKIPIIYGRGRQPFTNCGPDWHGSTRRRTGSGPRAVGCRPLIYSISCGRENWSIPLNMRKIIDGEINHSDNFTLHHSSTKIDSTVCSGKSLGLRYLKGWSWVRKDRRKHGSWSDHSAEEYQGVAPWRPCFLRYDISGFLPSTWSPDFSKYHLLTTEKPPLNILA